jgi:hypothetical protein
MACIKHCHLRCLPKSKFRPTLLMALCVLLGAIQGIVYYSVLPVQVPATYSGSGDEVFIETYQDSIDFIIVDVVIVMVLAVCCTVLSEYFPWVPLYMMDLPNRHAIGRDPRKVRAILATVSAIFMYFGGFAVLFIVSTFQIVFESQRQETEDFFWTFYVILGCFVVWIFFFVWMFMTLHKRLVEETWPKVSPAPWQRRDDAAAKEREQKEPLNKGQGMKDSSNANSRDDEGKGEGKRLNDAGPSQIIGEAPSFAPNTEQGNEDAVVLVRTDMFDAKSHALEDEEKGGEEELAPVEMQPIREPEPEEKKEKKDEKEEIIPASNNNPPAVVDNAEEEDAPLRRGFDEEEIVPVQRGVAQQEELERSNDGEQEEKGLLGEAEATVVADATEPDTPNASPTKKKKKHKKKHKQKELEELRPLQPSTADPSLPPLLNEMDSNED